MNVEELGSQLFPADLGDFSSKSFATVFYSCPKIVEYARNWSSATGIFLKFLDYVKIMLKNDDLREEHEKRCRVFVHSRPPDKIPTYMRTYKK